MVDCESQVIVAQDVVAEAVDVGQLGPMLDRCEELNGERPEQLLGDAGYWSEANAELEDNQTELFISTTKDWKRRKELREQGPPRGRIPDSHGPKELMERKLRTKRGRRIYKERSTLVEPVVRVDGEPRTEELPAAGEEGARAEWSLFSATTTCSSSSGPAGAPPPPESRPGRRPIPRMPGR